jgi:hypothetical protein
MLGAQLAPWRLWCSGLGQKWRCACGQFGLRTNQVTGAQGPQENCDSGRTASNHQSLGVGPDALQLPNPRFRVCTTQRGILSQNSLFWLVLHLASHSSLEHNPSIAHGTTHHGPNTLLTTTIGSAVELSAPELPRQLKFQAQTSRHCRN